MDTDRGIECSKLLIFPRTSVTLFLVSVSERGRNKEIEILTAKQVDMQTERQTKEVGCR